MKAFVMLSFLFSILGCSGNNTTEFRFEYGRAILWPQWKKSDDLEMRPHNFLIGLPESPASDLEGLKLVFSNGRSLSLSSKTTLQDLRGCFDRMNQYDVSGKRGPSVHPGKSYFEWPSKTTAIYKHDVITVFFTDSCVISLSLNNESDAIDKLILDDQAFNFPLKLDDLKSILGNHTETLRYFSQ